MPRDMGGLSNFLDPKVRRDIEALALEHDVTSEALVLEMATAYMRLLREVPGALPRNPMGGPLAAARKRGRS